METLVLGRDYYVVEGGYWVFTAEYLRRRGYCCGSGCRHCPYRERGTEEGKKSSEEEEKNENNFREKK